MISDDGRRMSEALDKADMEVATSNDPLQSPDTRLRILHAARLVFSQKGLGGARVNEIAAQARVNKQLIYYYFDDKEKLYGKVLEEAYRDIRERGGTLELESLNPDEAMAAFIRSNFDFLVENRHFVSLVNDENIHGARHIEESEQISGLHAALRQSLGRTLDRGIEEGFFARSVDPMELYISIASLTYFSFSNTFTLSAIFGTNVTSPERLEARREQVVEMILCFLKTPAGKVGFGAQTS